MTDAHDRNEPDLDHLSSLLRDPDVWADPPRDLERAVMDAVSEAVTAAPSRARRRRRPMVLVGAAAAVTVLIGAAAAVGVVSRDNSGGGLAIALSGTELAAAASATATIDRTPGGTRIMLDAHELGPADPGSYYQAWVTKGDTTVSAGSFHLRRGGGAIELWCGLDDPMGAELIVSLERYGRSDDAAPVGPSEHVVLVGTISGP